MADVPLAHWGRRLTDAIRAAIDAGDTREARRLALEGDGQTRSLATEYRLMSRGLGITIRAMLPLLPAVVSRVPPAARDAAHAELRALLRAFGRDLTTVMAEESKAAEPADRPGALPDGDVARVANLLDTTERRFDDTQARLAAEVATALETGDVERARGLLDVKERVRYLPLHDRLVRLMAEVFGWTLRHGGRAELSRLHLATAEGQRRGFAAWDALPAEEFARATAFLLKQHMGEVTVREDDDRFTIEQTLCGSGGRLRRLGAYEGPAALPFVDGAGPLTFGQPRLPVYCTHCPIWNGVAPLRWFGRPHWVFEDAARPDGSCTLHVYKRRDGAPPAYAAALMAEEP